MAIPMEVRLSMPWRRLYYWEAFYQAHVELPVLNSFMGSSIFIVVCLTGTRFLALFQPAKFRTVLVSKNARAQVAVLLAVVLAVLLSAPLVLLKRVICNADADARSNNAADEDGGRDVVFGGGGGSMMEATHGPICKAKENTDVTSL